MTKFKVFKIIFFFIMSLLIITGTLSAVIRTFFDKGFNYIYLIPVIIVLMNFTYIWHGKSQRNSFIFAVIIALATAIILRMIK